MPGTYHYDSSRGLASFSTPDGGGADITVERGSFVFAPRGSTTLTLVSGTVVGLNTYDPSGTWSGGCFMIPDSDFTMDPSMRSAHLQTTLPATSNCGDGTLMTIDHRVLHRPDDHSRGGSSIDLTWTWQGVVSTNQQNGQSACGSYHTEQRDTNALAFTTVTGSISGLGDHLVAGPYASLYRTGWDIMVTGSYGPLCAY